MASRILLINPLQNSDATADMYPSGALVLLGSMLHERNHQVAIVHMATDRLDPDGLTARVREFRPDIVGITMNSYQTRSARLASAAVKSVSRDILVVAGGPHPSALKRDLFPGFPDIDVGVYGEGEHTFLEIVEGKPLGDILGICTANAENPPRPPAPRLDYLPLPNLDLVPHLGRFTAPKPVKARPSMYLMASRGCPFDCTFCNKSVWGHKVRFRDPDHVIREIEWLHTRYGAREIFIQDDTFNLNRAWAEELLGLILGRRLNGRLAFRVACRANERLLDEALLRLARRAGVWLIFYGVESGSQRVLDRMRKGLTVAEIERAFRLTHEAGIKTYASFMVGNLGETRESVQESIALVQRIRPSYGGVALAIPFPGTELRRVLAEKHHLLEADCDSYTTGSCVIRTDDLTADELVALRRELADALRRSRRRGVLGGVRSLWRFLGKRLAPTDSQPPA